MISEPFNTTNQSNCLQNTQDDQLALILQFLCQLPYYALLLNENRKIVVSNNRFLTDHELEDVTAIFGKGPGDIFQCENAELAGCGNSQNCNFCGIFKTISECHSTNAVIINPCRLMVKQELIHKSL